MYAVCSQAIALVAAFNILLLKTEQGFCHSLAPHWTSSKDWVVRLSTVPLR